MKKMTQIDLGIISKYRNELFGWSAISVIILHYMIQLRHLAGSGLWYKIPKFYEMSIGAVGVEIFLFLSGMGLFFSMNNKKNIISFYKKRFSRILIPYLIWGLVAWSILHYIKNDMSFAHFMFDYSLLSFWVAGNGLFWYVAFIMVMYAIYPFIHFSFGPDKKKSFVALLIMLTVVYIGNMILYVTNHAVFSNVYIAISRIIVFLIGAYMGRRIYERDKIRIYDIALVIFGLIMKIGYLKFQNGSFPLNIMFGRIGNSYFAITMIFAYALFREYVSIGFLEKAIKTVGTLSLELYITHIAIDAIFRNSGITTGYIYNYLIVVAVSVIVSILLNKVSNIIIQKLMIRKI